MTPPKDPSPRPTRQSPAERSEELLQIQRQLKLDAAKRRESRPAETPRARSSRPVRKG